MTKCNNCNNPAEYVYASVGAETQYFCTVDVPWTLQDRLRSGSLEKVPTDSTTPEAVAPEAVAVEDATVAPTPEAVAPEAVADAVATDTVADAPTQTKTKSSKSAQS
jgi:hypothetical protein